MVSLTVEKVDRGTFVRLRGWAQMRCIFQIPVHSNLWNVSEWQLYPYTHTGGHFCVSSWTHSVVIICWSIWRTSVDIGIFYICVSRYQIVVKGLWQNRPNCIRLTLISIAMLIHRTGTSRPHLALALAPGFTPSVSTSSLCGPFYWHGLTLSPAWISNYIHCKIWDEITNAFLNFNGCTVEV